MAANPFLDPVPVPPPKPMLEAVRDVVTVKSDASSRPLARIQSTPADPPQSSRRAEDSQSRDRSKSAAGKPSSKSKKGVHVDVIDKLDISGLDNIALHHDGPFDACAPSRNRNKHKAPMMAWATSDDPQLNVPPVPVDSRVSPRAQATMAAMQQASMGFDSGPYPKVSTPGYAPNYDHTLAPPKKRHDALAEAWGIAEMEPFEEFFAGGGDHSRPASIHRGVEGKKPARDANPEERPVSKRREARSKLPPPAPLSLPGQSGTEDPQPSPSNYATSDGTPRRSKSLLGRIRKMKENPNVPLSADDHPGSPGSGKVRNSFDMLSREDAKQMPNVSRTSISPNDGSAGNDGDYFDMPNNSGVGSPNSGGGLGRKPSLMQRVVRGVRGNRQ